MVRSMGKSREVLQNHRSSSLEIFLCISNKVHTSIFVAYRVNTREMYYHDLESYIKFSHINNIEHIKFQRSVYLCWKKSRNLSDLRFCTFKKIKKK